jgi:predicted nucleic acid-binding Zn ribbon protein
MPAYQYVCPQCGLSQEISKPIAESAREERCDDSACNALLVRDFNGQASTFKLNGSGWTGKIRRQR